MASQKTLLAAAVCFGILLVKDALAFDIDGFKDGMPIAQAVSQAEALGLRVHDRSKSSILATSQDRLYALSFCNDDLVQVNKHLEPSFSTFVNLAAQLREIHGKPLHVWPSRPDATSSAPSHELILAWVEGNEAIEASHIAFETNTQTSVTFLAKNDCFGDHYFGG